MMELVRLAEYAEGKAKEDIAALLNKRSAMLEALTAMSAYRLSLPCTASCSKILASSCIHHVDCARMLGSCHAAVS